MEMIRDKMGHCLRQFFTMTRARMGSRYETRAERFVWGRVRSVQVQRVLAEPVDVLRQVSAQPRKGRLVELVPLVGELMKDASLGLHVAIILV
jgi:hypothetical protein